MTDNMCWYEKKKKKWKRKKNEKKSECLW